MDARVAGMIVVAGGLVVVVIGLGIASGALGWFGHLPGDIRFGIATVRVFVPIVSMLVVSLVLSLALGLLRRLF